MKHSLNINSVNRRDVLRVGSALALGTSYGGLSFAQSKTASPWPEKPVRIYVAGTSGGSADVVARAVGDQISRMTKQPFVVEAKPGGGGAIALNELMRAPADSYTLLLSVSSLVSEIPHIVKLPYDTRKAIVPLVEVARAGIVLVTEPNLPVKNLTDIVELSKTTKGGLSYASYSPGTMSHVAGIIMSQATGAKLVHIGYGGSTPGLTDVMGGHVPLMFDGVATSLPFIRSGKVKAISTTLPQRSALLPEIPTFKELGLPQLTYTGWMGLWGNSALPVDKQQAIRQTVFQAMDAPELKEVLVNAGFELGTHRDAKALSAELLSDYDRVGKLLKGSEVKS